MRHAIIIRIFEANVVIISNLLAIAMASVCMSYFVFLFLKGDYHSDVIQRCCVCTVRVHNTVYIRYILHCMYCISTMMTDCACI